MTTTYRIEFWGDPVEITADFADAECKVIGTDGHRVADFGHSPKAAMRYALEQLAESEGGKAADSAYEIDEALAAMQESRAGVHP
jgi:hypothetical protein